MGVPLSHGLHNITGLACGLRTSTTTKETFCLEAMLRERIDLYLDLCIHSSKCRPLQ